MTQSPVSNSSVRKRFATEDNIDVKGRERTYSNNTTQDTNDSFKSQQRYGSYSRKTSGDSLDSQAPNRTHSVVSMYSRKDDITIITPRDDEFTMKILNEYGNEMELEVIPDENREDNDFVLMEKLEDSPKKLHWCNQLKDLGDALTKKLQSKQDHKKSCLEEVKELEEFIKLF